MMLENLHIANNQLSGSMPKELLSLRSLSSFKANNNQLSGSLCGIPIITCPYVFVFENQLTGCLPLNLVEVKGLLASGNIFEGTIPSMLSSQLQFLSVSGRPRNAGLMTGHLPHTVARSGFMIILAASRQALQGVMPPFAFTILRLSLQNNELKAMSDVRFENLNKRVNSSVFVYNNLLSCHLPLCGDSTANISLSGLGNQLSHPKHGFPEWVSPVDRDRLFWITEREGSDRDEQYPLHGRSHGRTSEKFTGLSERDFFSTCPGTSQKLCLCINLRLQGMF